jgi:hypothetical protein
MITALNNLKKGGGGGGDALNSMFEDKKFDIKLDTMAYLSIISSHCSL